MAKEKRRTLRRHFTFAVRHLVNRFLVGHVINDVGGRSIVRAAVPGSKRRYTALPVNRWQCCEKSNCRQSWSFAEALKPQRIQDEFFFHFTSF
jgi:hypothetical protein